HEARIEQQTELLEEVLRALGDRLEGLDAGREDAGRLLDSMLHAHETEQQVVTMAARLSDEGKGDPMAPKELRPVLVGIAERLGKLLREEEEPISQGRRRHDMKSGGFASLLRDHSQKHVVELEQDALKLDDLIGRQR